MDEIAPGATLGSLDLDADEIGEMGAEFGVHGNAQTFIDRWDSARRSPLREVLAPGGGSSLLRDDPRSEALDLAEVEEALRSVVDQPGAFYDPEQHTLLDAAVRGSSETDRVVSLIYLLPSGRSARGVIPYDLVPGCEEEHARRQAVVTEVRARQLPLLDALTRLPGEAA